VAVRCRRPLTWAEREQGNVAVSWYDVRNDLGDGGAGDTDGIPNDGTQIWATYSTDGGVMFAPNLQVSEGAAPARIRLAVERDPASSRDLAMSRRRTSPGEDRSGSSGVRRSSILQAFPLQSKMPAYALSAG
jgi:hypothetical protein